jgi:hypothetical protein
MRNALDGDALACGAALSGITIDRFEAGKVVEAWRSYSPRR